SPARSPSGLMLLRYPQPTCEKGARMPDVSVTWLGHASFRVDSPGGKRIYVDPFLNGNPKCPESELEPEIVALLELNGWLAQQGAAVPDMGPNKGGTVEAGGVKFTLVNAFHSSASEDGAYLGEAAGLVLEFENGTKLYFAGDTCVFSDMQLIGRIYSPDVAILPIGGYFT